MIKQSDLNAAIRDIRLPDNMRHLPVSKKGYPVPFFVEKVDGEWDFRVIHPLKVVYAFRRKVCWVCGQSLGSKLAFVAGPMCIITSTTAEPPLHLSCARYAAIACPFLANPRMKRNAADMPEGHWQPGQAIMRNLGVAGILITREPTVPFNDGSDNLLLRMGTPEAVEWYAERRPATREEVIASVDSGLDRLYSIGRDDDPEAKEELQQRVRDFRKWLPECKQPVDMAAGA